MNRELVIVIPEKPSKTLQIMIDESIKDRYYSIIRKSSEIVNLQNKNIIFAVELKDTGINIELYKILNKLITLGKDSLKGSVGGVFVHSNNELFTRTTAQQIILYANMCGCSFPGRPLVEATGSLKNFNTLKKAHHLEVEELFIMSSKELIDRVITYEQIKKTNPNILVLHASNYETSNTLMLWNFIRKHLVYDQIKEIHIENGTVVDCIGCSYKTCKHYGAQANCYYGGIMVEEVYPAILECDTLIFLCPNYNDAVTSNISAVINRLSALFRKTKFYDKSIFSVIVSGNSGSDALAKQLISALNINKTFKLPPYYAIMETANDAGEILKSEGIEEKAHSFAMNIINFFK